MSAEAGTASTPSRLLRAAFGCASVLFMAAALYHVAALSLPSFARMAYPSGYSALRHAAFTIFDLGFAWLFVVRPRWLLWPFLALTVEVLAGHGMAAWRQWHGARQVDPISIACVIAVLLGLILLLRARGQGLPGAQHQRDANAVMSGAIGSRRVGN